MFVCEDLLRGEKTLGESLVSRGVSTEKSKVVFLASQSGVIVHHINKIFGDFPAARNSMCVFFFFAHVHGSMWRNRTPGLRNSATWRHFTSNTTSYCVFVGLLPFFHTFHAAWNVCVCIIVVCGITHPCHPCRHERASGPKKTPRHPRHPRHERASGPKKTPRGRPARERACSRANIPGREGACRAWS